MRKLRHNPIELMTRAVQPVLWLVVFGQVFTKHLGYPNRKFTLPGFPRTGHSGTKHPVYGNLLNAFINSIVPIDWQEKPLQA